MRKSRRNQKHNNCTGKVCISLIVFMLLIVMSIQIVNLNQKNQGYVAQEESLNEQLEGETQRQSELEEYEKYTQTQEYIEDTAKSKLGLVYNNEIVFKEKKN